MVSGRHTPASEKASVSGRLAALADGPRTMGARQILANVSSRLFGDEPAVEVGRFILEERIGSGGMGVVYRARDPQLDRHVALKLLHRGAGFDGDLAAKTMREAKAMAQVSHPNIVTVYDVGTSGEQMFIAMELVEGRSLRAWWDETPRSWRAVVEVMIEAARGLAAAHAAGLVHRDFKPDNVLVDAAGRAKVVDFGLARPLGDLDWDAADAQTQRSHPEDTRRERRAAVTEDQSLRSRAVAGTPVYMAPEQLDGHDVDAAADQFAFFVTLFEVLYGARPFRGFERNVEAITVPSGRRIPGWLHRFIVRGLAEEAQERWPSMDAVAERLARGLGSGLGFGLRTGPVLGGFGLLGAVSLGGAWMMGDALQRSGAASMPETPCRAGPQRVATVWGDTQREELRRRFDAATPAHGEEVGDRVLAELDQWREDWLEMYVDACEAHHVQREQSGPILDLRMQCLERRRSELRGFVDSLRALSDEAFVGSLDQLVQASDALTPVSACADIDALASVTPLPDDPRVREDVEALREELDRIDAEARLGRIESGVAALRGALDTARALGYEPLIAEVRFLLGSLQARAGDVTDSLVHLEQAYIASQSAGHDGYAARAATVAVFVAGTLARDWDESQRWERLARALIERGGNRPEQVASLQANVGTAALRAGKRDLARKALEEARSSYAEAFGPRHYMVGQMASNLAVLARQEHRYTDAAALYDEASDAMVESLGEHHPSVAVLHANLGALYLAQEQFDSARASLARALGILESTADPNHPSLANAYQNLGEVLAATGEHEEALGRFDRAREVYERTRGADHPQVLTTQTWRARSLLALGRTDEALTELPRLHERASSSESLTGSELAWIRLQYAKALGASQPGRARALASSIDELRDVEPQTLREAKAWLKGTGISPAPVSAR